MYNSKPILFFLGFVATGLLFPPASAKAQYAMLNASAGWQLVYENDYLGNTVSGSFSALENAVLNNMDIKVSTSEPDIIGGYTHIGSTLCNNTGIQLVEQKQQLEDGVVQLVNLSAANAEEVVTCNGPVHYSGNPQKPVDNNTLGQGKFYTNGLIGLIAIDNSNNTTIVDNGNQPTFTGDMFWFIRPH